MVSGKGIAALRVQGVAVTEGVLREECDALNRIFFHFITTKRPFVSMKYAMTMDGKIATVTGASKWITSEAAERMFNNSGIVSAESWSVSEPFLPMIPY